MSPKTATADMQYQIRHEFDPSLDSDPELKELAKSAAEQMDHECDYPIRTKAIWKRNPRYASTNAPRPLRDGPLMLTLWDEDLGAGSDCTFTVKQLTGDFSNYEILRAWSEYLSVRVGLLHSKVFGQEGTDEKGNNDL